MKYAEKAYDSIDGNDVLREHDIEGGEKVKEVLLQRRTEKNERTNELIKKLFVILK